MKQSLTDDSIESLPPFRFPVTWQYLSEPSFESVARRAAEPMVAIAVVAPTEVSIPNVSGSPWGTEPRAQWEMVIPKMERPAASRPRLAGMRVEKVGEAVSRVAPEPDRTAPDFSPSFLKADDSFLAKHWRWIAVTVVITAAIAFTFLVKSEPSAAPARQVEVPGISGGWSHSGVSIPGKVISIYDPSRGESDYRVEFGWVPDAAGVGWLFRMRDAGNYYGARLSLLRPGPGTALVVEHFAVAGGVESAHSRKVIPLARGGGMLRVRMDATGPAFTLWAQESLVDYWSDARLAAGAFGFYEQRGQRAPLQTVRFTLFQKGSARTAVTSFQ